MRVFKTINDKFSEVGNTPFKLEKDIQSLLEKNVTSIFDFLFIKSEFTLGKYRIDTLCFNEEDNAFVIIEYKKGKSYSVIDQGYTYLQLLLNNKSAFTLLLSQYYNKVLKENDINWSQSKIIFISPHFNAYQRDSINFKNLPFELWEIKRFEDGTVTLDQHVASSKVSINDIANPSNTEEKDIKKNKTENDYVSIEDLLKKCSPETNDYWNKLSESMMDIGEVHFVVNKRNLTLATDKRKICYIDLYKDHINITIERGTIAIDGTKSKNFFNLDDPKNLAKEKQWTWKSGVKGNRYIIKLTHNTDINYVLFLIKQKYNQILV